jgi:hypothetical protein
VNGGIYLKNKHGIHSYKFLVFLKVQLSEFPSNLAAGLDLLLRKTKKDGYDLTSMVFCLDRDMGVKEVLGGLTMSSEFKRAKRLDFFLCSRSKETFGADCRELLGLTF